MIVRPLRNEKDTAWLTVAFSALQLGSDILPVVLVPHSHSQRLASTFRKGILSSSKSFKYAKIISHSNAVVKAMTAFLKEI